MRTHCSIPKCPLEVKIHLEENARRKCRAEDDWNNKMQRVRYQLQLQLQLHYTHPPQKNKQKQKQNKI